jgi:hypothetical protein
MQARRSSEDEQLDPLLAEANKFLVSSKESKVENDTPPAPASPDDNEDSSLGERVKELVSLLLLSHRKEFIMKRKKQRKLIMKLWVTSDLMGSEFLASILKIYPKK